MFLLLELNENLKILNAFFFFKYSMLLFKVFNYPMNE